MLDLVLATKNAGKLAEVRQIMSGAGVRILGGDEIDFPEVEETGTTFDENALTKATAVSDYTGLAALADDSGLVVDALCGAPGVFSSRYAGEPANDEANIAKLLSELSGVPVAERLARFLCVAVFVTPGGEAIAAGGACEGRIANEPRGSGGFGYDPVFIPEGYEQTMAELDAETKNRISHRGKAFRALRQQLRAAGILG